jgi:hypothetical protein
MNKEFLTSSVQNNAEFPAEMKDNCSPPAIHNAVLQIRKSH